MKQLINRSDLGPTIFLP